MTDKQIPQLSPGKEHLLPFEYGSNRYTARIPQGVTMKELMDPAYWAHHAKDLRPDDEIRAMADDRSWMAHLIVLDCARTWARVGLLAHFNFAKTELSKSSEADMRAFIDAHEVKYRGPLKWSVLRRADSAVLLENQANKEDCTAWLDKHAREQIGVPAAPLVSAAA